MLLATHVGYSLGAAWAMGAADGKESTRDYRAVATMAIAADIIDRTLFMSALPKARHISTWNGQAEGVAVRPYELN